MPGLLAQQGRVVIAIEVGVHVELHGALLRIVDVEGVAEFAQQLGGQGIAVDDELAGIALAHLAHQVLQIDDLRIALARAVVVEHLQLVFAQKVGEDADAGVGVDDGGVLGHQPLLGQKMEAEAVHIAHKQAVEVVGLSQSRLNALLHPSGGTVGEGEARHVAEGHPMLVCPCDALGQHGRLAAAGRRQHQMVAAAGLDDALLLGIECSFHVCKIRHFFSDTAIFAALFSQSRNKTARHDV